MAKIEFERKKGAYNAKVVMIKGTRQWFPRMYITNWPDPYDFPPLIIEAEIPDDFIKEVIGIPQVKFTDNER